MGKPQSHSGLVNIVQYTTNGNISFVSGSNTLMFVSASGNVGIGTTTPDRKLVVNTNSAGVEAARFTDSNNADLVIGFPSSSVAMITAQYGTGGNLAFGYGSGRVEAMRVTSAGNLGIGTTSPGAILHTLKSGTAISGNGDEVFIGQRSNSTDNAAITVVSNAQSIIRFTNTSNTELGGVKYDNSSNTLWFVTNQGQRLTINSSGSVGIGTASPGYPLDVNGVINSNTGINILGTNNAILTLNRSTTSQYGFTRLGTAGTYYWRVGLESDGTNDYVFADDSNTSKMRLTTGGNLTFNSVPTGNYQIDSSVGISVANGGTINFPNFSGMIIVNNTSNGNIVTFLCGAGYTNITGYASTSSGCGTLSYNSGIGGYTWTSNYGSTAAYGVCAIRTRGGA
jgi:hypothetical protein